MHDPGENFSVHTLENSIDGFSIREALLASQPQPVRLDDPGILDPYSRAFFEQLMSAHPEWRDLCYAVATDAIDGHAVYLELKSPSKRLGKLWISTDQGVIVGVGNSYHAHFYTYEPVTHSEVFKRAIQFIDDVLEERLVLVVSMNGERRGSSWISSPENVSDVPEWCAQDDQCDRLAIFSWKTTFDQV